MRKSKKQITALVLAMGLVVTGNMVSYAATSVNGETKMEKPDATASMELIGTINITKLSVTLPLTVAFDVDPSAYKTTGADALSVQMDSPDAYQITNNSAVPVKVYISALNKGDLSGNNNSFNLVTDKAKGTDNKTVLLAIKKAEDTLPTYDTVGADYWLSESANMAYYMDEAGTGVLAASNVADGSNVMKLKVYGQTKNGWSQNDKFAIKPTFKVETVTTP